LFTPWLSFTEVGMLVFSGVWGFGPSFYSEPTKENPQTKAGLSLQHNLGLSGTSFWIFHDLSLWFMIAALASILLFPLARSRLKRPNLAAYLACLTPASLAFLSVTCWALFANLAVANSCVNSSCLSGLSGEWTDPSGLTTTQWGLASGFFLAVAAAVAMAFAGSTTLLRIRTLPDAPHTT